MKIIIEKLDSKSSHSILEVPVHHGTKFFVVDLPIAVSVGFLVGRESEKECGKEMSNRRHMRWEDEIEQKLSERNPMENEKEIQKITSTRLRHSSSVSASPRFIITCFSSVLDMNPFPEDKKFSGPLNHCLLTDHRCRRHKRPLLFLLQLLGHRPRFTI